MRTDDQLKSKPYELNITLFDLMQGDAHGPDQYQIPRFLCAHAIMFALEGMIGLYIHSMFACSNDYHKVEHTNSARSINRHRWDEVQLMDLLSRPSVNLTVYEQMKRLLQIRSQQAAFHPNATQFTLHISDQVFGFWRQCLQRKQSIFCLYNLSKQSVEIPLPV